MKTVQFDYDYIIIGSGFGGSVSALRLAEKGYRVLVIEKGKWFAPQDFPKSNWQLKKWLWMPWIGFHGLFKVTPFQHVSVLSGVGVGGGSLVYANTLPVPKEAFFNATTWAHLADWQTELAPFYPLALKMLGANPNPILQVGDKALQQLAKDIGKEAHFQTTNVAVYFGEPNVTVKDPYFEGRGPDRTGCNFCGGCMIGCQVGAKNTLDKNYLYLAQQHGAKIQAESLVHDVRPLKAADGSDGYRVTWKSATTLFKRRGSFTCKGVIFAAGVMGTVPLLLKLKQQALPRLSEKLGGGVRTNSESLIGVTIPNKSKDFSTGVAIGSILLTDEHSHLEPVRYPAGSGFWRWMMSPLMMQKTVGARLKGAIQKVIRQPIKAFKTVFVDDWAKRTQILLFMQSLDSTLRFRRGPFGTMLSSVDTGETPTCFIPEAEQLARHYADIVDGSPTSLMSETLLGIPTTAHILGGCTMGATPQEGVINKDNQVFGYHNMFICDGSMISANPGVNPSLTITSLSERAMSKVPPKVELSSTTK